MRLAAFEIKSGAMEKQGRVKGPSLIRSFRAHSKEDREGSETWRRPSTANHPLNAFVKTLEGLTPYDRSRDRQTGRDVMNWPVAKRAKAARVTRSNQWAGGRSAPDNPFLVQEIVDDFNAIPHLDLGLLRHGEHGPHELTWLKIRERWDISTRELFEITPKTCQGRPPG